LSTSLVRYSRDGDEFHYLWAARRCLKLLHADNNLVAVTIEGPSPNEEPMAKSLEAGEELIDIAEYFGSQNIQKALSVRYMQLKHSTVRTNEEWTASGLEKTIKGFAERFVELKKRHVNIDLTEKLEFWFVTNRPISVKVTDAVADAALNTTPRHQGELKKLERFTGLTGSELSIFCQLLHFEDHQDGYWDQRNILFQEVNGYLPDGDSDSPIQLKELVRRRALSESEQDPTITKIDVLRALKTDEHQLYPAECLIDINENTLDREQEPEIINEILRSKKPVIIHASGGIGKSVFATRISKHLPEGSVSILYDCFGNGEYRNAANYRHRHKDAFVQIANELAAKSLCHPLIPTAHADSSAYLHAFIYRLQQAINILRSSKPDARLCIIIDAADNAQMAAEEIGETRSFVQDLIRVNHTVGIHFVFLCRSHRQHLLDPPTESIAIELKSFSRNETTRFLYQYFPDASEHDIDEFHRLSSQNPRVQALALSQKQPLQKILRLLGPNPTSVEDTIANLLDKAIVKLKDVSGRSESNSIKAICAGLAILRPLVPISTLAKISGVDQEAIKSFAYDIGRPLLVTGESIQFLDEPTETWFRDKFKPSNQEMAGFITTLKPLANSSAYVASMLPQLMLEAGQLSELVELALCSEALPEGNSLEKRDIELQRLQFALKTSLRSQRYLEATKLTLKAGGETAGDERQWKLLQDNIDLASVFLEPNLIQNIVSRHTFSSGWLGSHHVYEAALLSGRAELVGEARSRFRMAQEWLQNWANLTSEESDKESVSDQDIVELTLTHLNIHGPKAASASLRRWSPREVSYRIGRLVTQRLIEHGRWADIDAMAQAAANNLFLAVAIITELRKVGRVPSNNVTKNAFRKLSRYQGTKDNKPVLNPVTAVIETALKQNACSDSEAITILTRYLPSELPRGFAHHCSNTRFTFLRAYCLLSALKNTTLELIDLVPTNLKEELETKNQHSHSRELLEFQSDIGALLPWHKLWALVFLNKVKKEDIANEISSTFEASKRTKVSIHREESYTSDEIALLWGGILHWSGTADDVALAAFNKWKDKLKQPLFTPTLNMLCKVFSQQEYTKKAALSYATESYLLIKAERSDAENKSTGYLEVARAIYTTSKADAKAYFDEAMEVAGKIGDENLARWNSILDLANHASHIDAPSPEIAYQLARCAELTYDYVHRDKHFAWNDTVLALCGLCPSSAITILSRWRDRAFGWHERLLPVAIKSLINNKVINPYDALPLIGFRAQWDYAELLELLLSSSNDEDEKQLASSVFYSYIQFSNLTTSELEKVKEVANEHGTISADLIEITKSGEQEKNTLINESVHYVSTSEEVETVDWNEIFTDCDLSTVDDLSTAYNTFKRVKLKSKSPLDDKDFFKEVILRVPVGLEPSFIKAVANTLELNLYSLKYSLELIPKGWKDRPATSHALRQFLETVCRRHYMKINKNRYYEALPFNLACSSTGISEVEIIDFVLSATSETPDLIEAEQLFSLVGLLVVKLSHDEALEALKYGLDLLNPMLEETDGDGSWRKSLLPPDDVRKAIAGYIWSALAAPEAVLRWEAAHAVLELCRLGRQDIISYLVEMATTKSGGPFIDTKLPFYSLHALQWLLIGFARAALEAPRVLAPYSGKLIDWALNDQPHVLIRQFAARTALQLIESGYLVDEDGLSELLKGINKSSLPVVDSQTYKRGISHNRNRKIETDEDQFSFGLDIGPYWYQPLGRVFALSQNEIEMKALKVIRQDFKQSSAKGYWDEDERAKQQLYEYRDTSHSHGSYPRTDNLHFYHSYHAMMIVAGQLLATTPTHSNPDYGEDDEFADWFSGHDLTRQDGRWLWDRRDSEPIIESTWLSRDKKHPEYLLVTDSDFKEALQSGSKLNLYGSWTVSDANHEQSVSIYSALVTPENSGALLRALTTADNIYDYAIPCADSSLEINKLGFELLGWVQSDIDARRLDEYDRWAGDIPFPPLRPAEFIIKDMQLHTDLDFRVWSDTNSTSVMESQVWGCYDESKHNESSNPNRGSRLQVSISFIALALEKLERELIIDVQIKRQRRYQPYNSGKENDEKRPETYSKLYILDKGGKLRTC